MFVYIYLTIAIIFLPLVLWFCFKKRRIQKGWRRDLTHLMEQMGFDYVVFDIRSMEEYISEHILGAVHFPMEQIEYLPIEDLFIHIFIYGNRREYSDKAYCYLHDNGYFNVYDLGPYKLWKGLKESGRGMEIQDFTKQLEKKKEQEKL
ncbi:MAG: rhodanese-like domain-containing protein [Spirochaetaceae bacterium]|jgi:rhodanese-related sulfurtransferase|nr:rhodanese-like domain-containing protein [Spirochaetaceae bacterium]